MVIAGEGQITERFTRAVEQLGERGKFEVRLGGIYALERIARDSQKDHWPIMEVLTGYVRAKTKWHDQKPAKPPPFEVDVQAALTVVGRRCVEFEKGVTLRLELSESDLRGADLVDADFRDFNLLDIHLEYRNEADLESAANLWGARLNGALLGDANLKGAYLRATDLRGVDLSGVKGLTRRQIEQAITDETTVLPDYLSEEGEEGKGGE